MRSATLALSILALSTGCDAESSASIVLFDALTGGDAGVIDLAQLGPVRLSENGPVAADGEGSTRLHLGHSFSFLTGQRSLTLPVVQASERPAVRWADQNVELVLFVDREDARSWTLAPTSGGLALDSDAVRFEAGVMLEQLDERDGARLVRYSERDFWLDAWVPALDVDHVRDVEPFDGDVVAAEGETVWVRPNTDFFDGANGPWMGRFQPAASESAPDSATNPRSAARLGQAEGGMVPVGWAAKGVQAAVWVKQDRLVAAPSGLFGWGMGGSSGWGCGHSFRSIMIPAGTELLDGIDGHQVGVVLRDYEVLGSDVGDVDGEGWQTFSVATPWGDVETWLPPDSVVDIGLHLKSY